MGGCPWRFAQRYVLPASQRNVMGPKGVETMPCCSFRAEELGFKAGIWCWL